MGRRAHAVMLILVTLFCTSAILARDVGLVSLTGTIRDVSGRKASRVTVTVILLAEKREVASEVTDDAGAFHIADFPLHPGDYEIWVHLGSDTLARKRFQVSSDSRISSSAFEIIVDHLPMLSGARPPGSRKSKSIPPPRNAPVPRSAPAPSTGPPPRELPREAPPAPDRNYIRVRVFYATDRNTINDAPPAKFYGGDRGERANSLRYGSCEVSIPKYHVPGELEAPSIWRLEFREDPEKHVVLLSVQEAEPDGFYAALQGRVAASLKREAFVFIHGYNVTFEDAARRAAQLSYDMRYDAAPILYSWPSAGTTAGYFHDEQNVEWTVPHLRQFLSEVRSRSGANVVHLIAHSMGNRALVNALQTLPVEPGGPRFQQIVLAAPDIDKDVFASLAQKVIEQSQRVTLYSSSNDEALVASKKVHGYPRLGDSTSPIFIYPGIDTVDVSTVKTDFLGHSYYGESRTVLDDLVILLSQGLTPGLRRLKQLDTPGIHWAMSR